MYKYIIFSFNQVSSSDIRFIEQKKTSAAVTRYTGATVERKDFLKLVIFKFNIRNIRKD